MLGIKYRNSRINNNKTNVSYNVNNYYNNGGGASTMKKKYGNKFNNAGAHGVSQGSTFSLNGNANHYYVGNPNSNFSHDPFSNISMTTNLGLNKNTSVSVKNTKGLFQTRLKSDNKIVCNPVNSFDCYKKVNIKLQQQYDNDIYTVNTNDSSFCNVVSSAGFNKHFRSENKDSSSKIERAKCVVDRSNYKEQLKNMNTCSNNSKDSKKCNITKDLTAVNSYVVGYDVYMLKKKKCCSYNPPDAKVIAC